MKIAIVTKYKDFYGGVETVTGQLKKVFEQEGHIVDVVALDSVNSAVINRSALLSLLSFSRYVNSIKDNYDILICNGEYGFGVKKEKCINLFHGSYYGYRKYLGAKKSFKQQISLIVMELIQKEASRDKTVIAVSSFIKELLVKQNIKVFKVIKNSVDTDLFKPDIEMLRNERKCLFVGSFDYYGKGFDILEEIADKGQDVTCIANQKPSDKLSWIDKLPHDKMPSIYNKFGILLFPSRFEAMQLVPIEAMACGIPVVISNVGLGPELIKEIPEFVVDLNCNNPSDEFFKRIQMIQGNYNHYSIAAREYAIRNHSMSDFKNSWISILKQVERNELVN